MTKRTFSLSTLVAAILATSPLVTASQEGKYTEARWINWPALNLPATPAPSSPYDMALGFSFLGPNGEALQANNCMDVSAIGDGQVAERSYTALGLAKANCEAVLRFFAAQPTSKNGWASPAFDFEFLLGLPAAVAPNTGPAAPGLAGKQLRSLNPQPGQPNTDGYSVEVKLADMAVNYVLLAKADFNQDGYQDWFIRLDWAVEGTFGSGHDWVVVTQLPGKPTPVLLWRSR